jgi:hypothetical protein
MLPCIIEGCVSGIGQTPHHPTTLNPAFGRERLMQIVVGDRCHLGKPGGFHAVLESFRVLIGVTKSIPVATQLLNGGHPAASLLAHCVPNGESLSHKLVDLGVLGGNGSAFGEFPAAQPLLHDDVAFDPLQFGFGIDFRS